MNNTDKILLGKTETLQPIYLNARMANRHGLIAGATGTGKTVSLKVLAEAFSNMGVPVVVSDVKGDLSGLVKQGGDSASIAQRIEQLQLMDFNYQRFPVEFYDLFHRNGHPIRTSVSDMGATLLSRILELSDVQQGVLNAVFHIADDLGLLLIDLKDLQAMLTYVSEHNSEFSSTYGNMSKQSISAILRHILTLQDNGGDYFFGEPEMDVLDWLRLDANGNGIINVIDSTQLVMSPLIYSTFLLWMLSELYENLPEVGDLDKPRLVFFFDEAHLLFKDTSKALVQKIEQVIKLVRSKGVGIYFVTQNPLDLPDSVLAQCSNRIIFGLRAYTANELKNVKSICASFRANPYFDSYDALLSLKTGEALVSCLESNGTPSIVQRVLMAPPQSSVNAIDQTRRMQEIRCSEIYGKYEVSEDSESAYEQLSNLNQQAQSFRNVKPVNKGNRNGFSKGERMIERATTRAVATITRETSKDIIASVTGQKRNKRKSTLEKAANSMLNSLSYSVSKELTRGLFGILKKQNNSQ